MESYESTTHDMTLNYSFQQFCYDFVSIIFNLFATNNKNINKTN